MCVNFSPSTGAWIGLSDAHTPGVFRWSTSRAATSWQNWHLDNPRPCTYVIVFVVFKKTVVSDHMVIDVSDNVSVVSDHMFSGCPCTMRRVTDSVCKDDEK